MEDKDKTKEQLIRELVILRNRISDLEVFENECNQAEETLRIAQQNFRNSTDNLPLGILVVNDEDKMLYANQAVLNIFGYSSLDEFMTIPKAQRYTPDSLKVIDERRRMAGKVLPSNYEVSIVRKDGTIRNVEVFNREVVWNGGKERQTLWQDITERKRAEGKYRLIVKTAFDGFYLSNLEGELLEVNDSYCEMLGYTQEELLGMSIADIEAIETPDDVTRHIQRIIESGCDFFETRHRHKDGSEIDVEISVNFLDMGEKQLFVFVRDITERKQADKALQESEEKLWRLFESINDGIVITDLKGNIIDLNKKILQLGRAKTKSQILGKNTIETIAPRDRQRALTRMSQLLQEGIFGSGEFSLIREDGSEYPAEISANLYRDASGLPAGFIAIIRDITERRAAIKELRDSELKYRELAESISDIFFAFDENLRYTYWNKASEKLTGISVDDVIGKHFSDIFPRDEQTKRIEEVFLKVIETKKPQFIVNSHTFRGKEYVLTISAYRSKGGVSVFIKDITEHINAVEKLQESEQRYRAIINLGGEVGEAIIMVQDTDRGEAVQTFVSDVWTHITGYSQEELLGMSFIDLVHPDYRKASLERHRRKMKGEDIPGYFEMIIIKKDGTEVPIELTSAYTQYEGEGANVAFIRDITERKQVEDRERQLQEELALSSRLASIGELAAGVAHELNNPLTAVLGYSERLLRNNYDQNTIGSLEKINSEALRASKVIDNLITFARRREPKNEYSDINNIVQTALELRAYELKTSNIEVEVELAGDLPEVIADFHQMEQVFLNMILNAEQAMTETKNGGKLIIRTKRLKNSVRISFTDNGPGIPEENIDKIFDPFFTTRGNKAGTGLGLSICHGIVQEHGGKICARSKPGKGTTFNIEIPLKTRKRKNKKTPQEVLL